MRKVKGKVAAIAVALCALSAFAGLLNQINCPDCGAMVSTRAFMCPKCGCAREAILQQLRAVERLSLLPPDQRRRCSNDACFGQMGRIARLNEERIVRNVLTNETVATASYDSAQKRAAHEASLTIRRILELGFTMDQIFVMRPDLVRAALGGSARPYGRLSDD